MKCNCDNGQVFAHVNYGERNGECHGEWKFITCPDCGGSGEVPDIWAEWRKRGIRLRYWMETNELTLRKAARQFHIDVCELSRMEHGKANPDKFIEKLESQGEIVPTVRTCRCGCTEFVMEKSELLGEREVCKECHR